MSILTPLIFLLVLTIPGTFSRSLEEDTLLEELVRELRDYEQPHKREISIGGSSNDAIKGSPLVEVGDQAPSVRVGAFNIQVFGDRKYSKTFVKRYLLKILPRYDVLLIQEIRDADGDSFLQLLIDLNEIRSYDFVLSGRLGRSSSKEQYAYIFDSTKFEAESAYQFADPKDDFERPPYGVVLKSTVTALPRFGLLGVHTKPSKAPEEISKMADVYDVFKRQFNLEDVVLMGDFNAGCSYVTRSEWKKVKLRHDERFTWWIDDDADTTVAASDCPYDRIVSAGKNMKRAIVPDSVTIFRFDQEYGLRRTVADDISDHYPVEFALFGKLSAQAKAMTVAESFSVTGDLTMNTAGDHSQVTALGYTVTSYQTSGQETLMELSKNNVDCGNVVATLKELKDKAPGYMTGTTQASVEAYLNSGILDHVYPFPGNLADPAENCDVKIQYKANKVIVTVSRAALSP